jgi:hypothetical protein
MGIEPKIHQAVADTARASASCPKRERVLVMYGAAAEPAVFDVPNTAMINCRQFGERWRSQARRRHWWERRRLPKAVDP